MRYDDPARPTSLISAVHTPLQVNGSPLPTITLMYPMQNADQNAEGEVDGVWGWLACVHAHRASNRFGTYYGWIRDLGQFQRDYLFDPEAALLHYFKYAGPDWEPTEQSLRPVQEIQEEIF
jgi:hypothetical protein